MPFGEYEGDDQPPRWKWEERGSWRRGIGEEGRPEVLLRQVGPNLFQLSEGFRYTAPAGAPAGAWNVPRHDPKSDFGGNNSTDLASVPSWLWWFIASHGHHSRAALLHDHIIDLEGVTDEEANRAFRDALAESGVPILRRWLMWDAVSLATMLRARWWWKLAVVAFGLHLAAFTAALGYSLYRSWETLAGILGWPFARLRSLLEWIWSLVSGPIEWVWSHLDVLLPGPLDGNPWWRTALIGLVGLVWRKRWLISLAGLLLILLPTLAVFGSYVVAWLLEHLLRVLAPLAAVTSPSRRDERAPVRAPPPTIADPFRKRGGPV
jgi:hypothetical protein